MSSAKWRPFCLGLNVLNCQVISRHRFDCDGWIGVLTFHKETFRLFLPFLCVNVIGYANMKYIVSSTLFCATSVKVYIFVHCCVIKYSKMITCRRGQLFIYLSIVYNVHHNTILGRLFSPVGTKSEPETWYSHMGTFSVPALFGGPYHFMCVFVPTTIPLHFL